MDQRLDSYLGIKYPHLSRKKIRQLLNDSQVKVNREIEFRPHRRLSEADQVEVNIQVEPAEAAEIDYPDRLPQPQVVYEDSGLLVIDKPYGIKAHPTLAGEGQTVVDWVAKYFQARNINSIPRLINRLDIDTSGLLAIALNREAAIYYTQQFMDRNVEKYYVAITKTNSDYPQFANFKMIDNLGYDNVEKSVYISTQGEYAESEAWVLSQGKEYSVVLVRLYTGRKHQIRVQLASRGLNILGDKRYEGPTGTRLMLHSLVLKIQDEHRKLLKLYTELPIEFKNLCRGEIDQIMSKIGSVTGVNL